jgi:hypothetical protein
MSSKDNPIAVPPQEDLTEVKKPTSLLVAQFFLFPLIIIAFGVGIFVLFGVVAYEEKSPEAYLTQIRNGRGSSVFDRRMWQAATELTNVIAVRADELRDTPFASELLDVYVEARPNSLEDPADLVEALRLRRFLALSLGHLGNPEAVGALSEGLDDQDSETQLWTLWSLGEIADPMAAEAVANKIGSSDAAVRKMAVYVLGVLKNPIVIDDLQIALNDPAPDVRWNAAMSLAQLGDASGSELLMRLTSRDFLAQYDLMSDEDRENVITNAVQCLGLLKLDGARDHLVSLSEDDPSLKVRDAALAALEFY